MKKIVGRDEELEPLEIRLKEGELVGDLHCGPIDHLCPLSIMISYLIPILICLYKSLS